MAPDQVMKVMSNEDQIMQVKSDGLRCKLCWSQHVRNFQPCNHVVPAPSFSREDAQGEPLAQRVSAATLISQKFLKTKNGEAVDVALSEMDRVDDNDDDDESGMDEYEGEKSSENFGI
jgi:hypothetical protein